jgi:hypothetical protein
VGGGSITAELTLLDGRTRKPITPAAAIPDRVSLGPVSPMDRPGPTDNKQTPGWGWYCAEQESAYAATGRSQTSLHEPDPTADEARQGSCVPWREAMKHFCVDRKPRHLCLELKVCEGCGALWLRAQNHGAYCRRCALRLSDFPPPRGRSRAGRKRKIHLAVCTGEQQ